MIGLDVGRTSHGFGPITDAQMASIVGRTEGRCEDLPLDSETCKYKASQSGCHLVCTQKYDADPPDCPDKQHKGMNVDLRKTKTATKETGYSVQDLGQKLCREEWKCKDDEDEHSMCNDKGTACYSDIGGSPNTFKWKCRNCEGDYDIDPGDLKDESMCTDP